LDWRHVSINKGVHIGNGSIIGTRSVVTKDVPPVSLYAGSPARELKTGVTWSRERYASAALKTSVLKRLGFDQFDAYTAGAEWLGAYFNEDDRERPRQ